MGTFGGTTIELMPGIKPSEARVASASNCPLLAGLYAMLAFSWTYSSEEKIQILSFTTGPPRVAT